MSAFARSAAYLAPIALLLAGAAPAPAAEPAPTGLWYGVLDPAAGVEMAFELRVERKGKGLSAVLRNPPVETPFTSASWDGSSLDLELAAYDARIVAHRDGDGLVGTYTRNTGTVVLEVPFRASPKAPAIPVPAAGAPSVAGEWGMVLGPAGKEERLLGSFRQDGGRAWGTLLSTSGDYGPLHGTFDGRRLVLTVFNGFFIYRLTGEVGPDGSLAGEFRARASAPQPWHARRLDAASAATWLPDGGSIVRAKDPSVPFTFSLPEAPGKVVSSEDPAYAGRPMIVTFLGTWCPNCHDEAPLLVDLSRRYRAAGLRVVALSYEYTADPERSFRQIARFKERYGIDYPVLLAGTTKDAASSAPRAQLAGFGGYPTTLFLDRSHRIVRTHTGFDGPATGERFARLKKETEEAVRSLLAGTAQPSSRR